jgi:hypothetical protein
VDLPGGAAAPAGIIALPPGSVAASVGDAAAPAAPVGPAAGGAAAAGLAARAHLEARYYPAAIEHIFHDWAKEDAYLFAALGKYLDPPQPWLDGLNSFGHGNCEKHVAGYKVLLSGQHVPNDVVWVCRGGGWFPDFDEAFNQGLYYSCRSNVNCGRANGGFWGD